MNSHPIHTITQNQAFIRFVRPPIDRGAGTVYVLPRQLLFDTEREQQSSRSEGNESNPCALRLPVVRADDESLDRPSRSNGPNSRPL